jgi:hypothetical protein
VAIATTITASELTTPNAGNNTTNTGTITSPPPIPNKPARKPAKQPISAEIRITVNKVLLNIDAAAQPGWLRYSNCG